MYPSTEMTAPQDTHVFEETRPKLVGLAYRILGSLADAEDAVQDTFIKWSEADRESIDNTSAWLMTVCTRRCLDLRRAGHRKRVSYVGAWLPEPVQTRVDSAAEEEVELASSLSMAFLLMLERLSAKECAAFLLHDVFDQSYDEISRTLGIGAPACRKLVSRARGNVSRVGRKNSVPLERQDALLHAFQQAVAEGDETHLAAHLAQDIRLRADGGGKVAAVLHPVEGRIDVLDFVAGNLRSYWSDYTWEPIDINGSRGALIRSDNGIEAALSFAYDADGKTSEIFIIRNPDKLTNLDVFSLN